MPDPQPRGLARLCVIERPGEPPRFYTEQQPDPWSAIEKAKVYTSWDDADRAIDNAPAEMCLKVRYLGEPPMVFSDYVRRGDDPEPATREVTGCTDFPFADWRLQHCCKRAFKSFDESRNSETPDTPDWCPLKSGPVLVRLKVGK